MAAPATVSGECRAEMPLGHSGPGRRRGTLERSASQETCFQTVQRAAGGVPRGLSFRDLSSVASTDVPALAGRERLAAPGKLPGRIGIVLDNTSVATGVTRLLVCSTCRAEGDGDRPPEQRVGARFLAALRAAAGDDPAVEIVAVECLSVCRRPCTVGLSAPGKWTYVYGDLPVDGGAAVILDALKLYAASPDGLIPWKLRSDPIKKGVVARLPPSPEFRP